LGGGLGGCFWGGAGILWGGVLGGGGGGTLNTGCFGLFLGPPGYILDDAKDRNKERNEQTKGCKRKSLTKRSFSNNELLNIKVLLIFFSHHFLNFGFVPVSVFYFI
jgi:hypothetical protein